MIVFTEGKKKAQQITFYLENVKKRNGIIAAIFSPIMIGIFYELILKIYNVNYVIFSITMPFTASLLNPELFLWPRI